ncbi:N-acetylmuramidase domain-containing protein [Flavobacterium foetidum]|uniref:N-acetylmuramidase domain-containing protein n=1 Tax=Flavobacterium foetidum TaxID=2026681 RepID=UPI001FCA2471|nr:N-acetylmuramidase domain-containing protein [Flavobacterium foetidum]
MIQDDFAFVDSGGTGEYRRLEKAKKLSQDKKVVDAASSGVSWGLFQLMGFNAVSLGYRSIDEFVKK